MNSRKSELNSGDPLTDQVSSKYNIITDQRTTFAARQKAYKRKRSRYGEVCHTRWKHNVRGAKAKLAQEKQVIESGAADGCGSLA